MSEQESIRPVKSSAEVIDDILRLDVPRLKEVAAGTAIEPSIQVLEGSLADDSIDSHEIIQKINTLLRLAKNIPDQFDQLRYQRILEHLRDEVLPSIVTSDQQF